MTDEALYRAIELTGDLIRMLEPNHDVEFLMIHLKELIREQHRRLA